MIKKNWLRRALIVIVTFASATAVRADDAAQPLRILFIGNSYTYFNNLPVMLERIAASATPPRKIETKAVVVGGATLRQHWEKKTALGVIQSENWDFVVLQEQSSLGVTFMIDGQTRITDYTEFHKYVRLFDEAIRKKGAKTVLYGTWARKDAPQEDQAMLDYAFASIAKELHAVLVPAGITWQAVRKAKPSIELYNADGSHPSPAGTYLTASCFLATLLNESSIGSAHEITGPAMNTNGQPKRNSDRLAKLDQPTATFLQTEAWEICSKLTKSGGYPDVSKPAAPELPTLPNDGDTIKPEALEGRWVGSTKLYSRSMLPNQKDWPVKMIMTCSRKDGVWELSLTVALGNSVSNTPQKLTNVVVQDKSLSFTDPARNISGANPTCRAILKDGKLLGITEIKSKDARFFAIGTWEMHKE
jgi:uncharacterized protein DUF4886